MNTTTSGQAGLRSAGRGQKIKASKEANKKKFASQTIKINDEWKIVRLDELNWQIKQKGKKEPWDRWYYGTLQGAFADLPRKMLSESQKNSIEEIERCYRHLIEEIEYSIGKLGRDVNR